MYLNAAFYRFFSWTGYQTARALLRERCVRLGLKGTVLVSPEGINGSICGTERDVRAFLSGLRDLPGLEGLRARETWSSSPSFKRLKIRPKKKIISMGSSDADPSVRTGLRLAPAELKRWLDEGRDFVLVDTRNAFEVDAGSFRGALDLKLGHFHDFPARLKLVEDSAAGRPVVMFCTGGIRCERATALALERGMPEVYQLDGGILGYFESCGGAHFEGGCFVFDDRETVFPEAAACS
jgi:predicted sulfurtransferase